MKYSVFILRRAQKQLSELPVKSFERLRDVIRALGENTRPPGCRKLTGREGWRLRVGNYRVLYEIDEKRQVVTILDVGHRREVYR